MKAKRITFNAQSHGVALALGTVGSVKSILADDKHTLEIDEERRVVIVSFSRANRALARRYRALIEFSDNARRAVR